MAQFPSVTSASDIWDLQDQYRAKAGYNWPGSILPPSAPTSVSASAGNSQATVSFTAPTDTGGGTISGYRVTSSPSGITATGSSYPITISGLTNGVAYTFTVAAQNEAGYGSESSPSNSVTPNSSIAVNYLVVAGGGGGGDRHGGGGGAGGYIASTAYLAVGSTYTITVGAGGAGGNYEDPNSTARGSGLRGDNSSISGTFTTTAKGGGGGATYDGYSNQGDIGSGGGGAGNGTYWSGVAAGSNGYAGGNGNGSGTNGGGGGGASAAGNNYSGNNGGTGGSGAQWVDGNYYAGGGGGASGDSIGSASGGIGGGGTGGWNTATAGTANTGGGGGGCRSNNEPSRGADGGSGVVIIRCADSITASSTTGSPTVTTGGGYRYYKFTASGSITF